MRVRWHGLMVRCNHRTNSRTSAEVAWSHDTPDNDQQPPPPQLRIHVAADTAWAPAAGNEITQEATRWARPAARSRRAPRTARPQPPSGRPAPPREPDHVDRALGSDRQCHVASSILAA